jgi:hypothetical protein
MPPNQKVKTEELTYLSTNIGWGEIATNKLHLTGQNLGRVINSKVVGWPCCYIALKQNCPTLG